jgi:hypothetical protein
MQTTQPIAPKLHRIWRTVIEVGFIVFLYYSNLLMGEYVRSKDHGKNLLFAICDIFTVTNFVIAIVSALIAYLIFEFLRSKL